MVIHLLTAKLVTTCPQKDPGICIQGATHIEYLIGPT